MCQYHFIREGDNDMSDASTTTRKFPGYTTKELKAFVATAGETATPVMIEEIARREVGVSTVKVVPQVHVFEYRPFIGR